jgi:hypothetical protein
MIPKVRTWRVSVYWDKPEGTTVREVRHYYVKAPTKRFAWWNGRDDILADVGAARFIARDRVTIGLTRKWPNQCKR